MSQQMRVIEITKAGDPSVLKPATRSVPDPKYGDVLIKIAFAGVNRPDALQRAGLYNPPPTASDLPGLEASGTIVRVGDMPNTRRHLLPIVCQFPKACL